jgi:putative aldouronate transport system substrate-binding protein
MAKIMFGFQLSDPSILITDTMQDYFDLYKGTVKKEDVSPTNWDGYQALVNTDKRSVGSFASVYEYWTPFAETNALMVNENVATPTDTAVSKKALLDTMEKEVFSQIIMGGKPLDSFDKFVLDWKANGGEQWTKEVNAWYTSTKTK